MKDQDSSLAEMRLRIHRQRIQSQLSSAAMSRCRHIAWSLRPRLPVLLSTTDWSNGLFFREVRFAIEQQGIGKLAGLSLEDLAILIMFLAGEEDREELEDELKGMKKANEERKKVRAMLARALDEKERRKKPWPPW